MKSGVNSLKLNPNSLSSGIYFLKVTSMDKYDKILITKKNCLFEVVY